MKTAESKTTASQFDHQGQSSVAPFFQLKEEQSSLWNNGEPFFSPAAPAIQAKLSIGQPGDQYEQEADAMADQVVSRVAQSTDAPGVQRMCPECAAEEGVQKMDEEEESLQMQGMEEEEEPIQAKEEEEESVQMQAMEEEEEVAMKVQRKPIFESNEEPGVQRKCAACSAGEVYPKRIQRMGGAGQASGDLENRLNSSKGSGNPLPEDTRSSMESAFGTDFSGVKVHTDNSSVQMNQDLGAQAFTHGPDIYFNSGKYETGSTDGQKLLAHELTHVVQQGEVG